jgi:hypothetical protein
VNGTLVLNAKSRTHKLWMRPLLVKTDWDLPMWSTPPACSSFTHPLATLVLGSYLDFKLLPPTGWGDRTSVSKFVSKKPVMRGMATTRRLSLCTRVPFLLTNRSANHINRRQTEVIKFTRNTHTILCYGDSNTWGYALKVYTSCRCIDACMAFTSACSASVCCGLKNEWIEP